MLIYLLLGAFIVLAAIINNKNNDKTLSYYAILSLLIVLCFVRGTNVGTDIQGYSFNFNRMNWNPSSWNAHGVFEYGFNLYLAFFRECISSDAMLCLGTIGVIYIWSVNLFIKKYSLNLNISLMLFVLLGFYTNSFNTMRQYFASGLFLLFTLPVNLNYYSKKGFFISFASIILLGFFFHNAMLLLVFSLIYYMPVYEKIFTKTSMIVLIIISMIAFYSNFIFSFFNSYFSMIPFVTDKMRGYVLTSLNLTDNVEFSLIRTSLNSLFAIFIIYISPKTKNYFLFAYFISIIILNILAPLNGIFIRVGDMFSFFSIIYMANLWENIKKKKFEVVYKISLLCFSIVLYLNLLIKNYGEVVPYTMRFLNN